VTKKRKAPRLTQAGYPEQKPLRGADEPTAWDEAAERLTDCALRQWVGCHYRSKYVPEEVLAAYGFRDPW
jgi:hypothetical protein